MIRSIVRIPAAGASLVGTCHLPPDPASPRVGFLFLNAGAAPRAGNSDVTAYVCDQLASGGFPAFRFDLPGLGDSAGDLPFDLRVFWRSVQVGRNVAPTIELARQLRARFGLTDLVVGGMCSGAVTSLLAGDQAKDAVSGLILLEPNFRVSTEIIPPSEPRPAPSSSTGLLAGLRRIWRSRPRLHHLTRPGYLSHRIGPILPIFLRFLTLVAGPPREVNWPVVAAWRRALQRRVPVLLATAENVGEDYYCRRLLAEFPRLCFRSLTEVSVPDTNHIMTRGQARSVLAGFISEWARAYRRNAAARNGSGTARPGGGNGRTAAGRGPGALPFPEPSSSAGAGSA